MVELDHTQDASRSMVRLRHTASNYHALKSNYFARGEEATCRQASAG